MALADQYPTADTTHAAGRILPCQAIEALIADRAIALGRPVADGQIQPASLDLRLGEKAYRIRASFLPGPGTPVAEKLQALALHEIDLKEGAVLEVGCVYLVPLLESIDLPEGLSAACNPSVSLTWSSTSTSRAISSCTTKISFVSRSNLFDHRTRPVLASTSLANTRIRSWLTICRNP